MSDENFTLDSNEDGDRDWPQRMSRLENRGDRNSIGGVREGADLEEHELDDNP